MAQTTYESENDKTYSIRVPLIAGLVNPESMSAENYKVMDVTTPVDIAIAVIDETLLIAYTQVDPKTDKLVLKKKFINLKDLLKQKPVSVRGPEKIQKQSTPAASGTAGGSGGK